MSSSTFPYARNLPKEAITCTCHAVQDEPAFHLSFSEAFRVMFQINCIALTRSTSISTMHSRTFNVSINGTAFPGLSSNVTEFFQTRLQR